MNMLTLPKWQEDDRFDQKKLQNWLEWGKEFFDGKVKEEQRKEGETDRDIVDDCNIKIAIVNPVRGRQKTWNSRWLLW